MLIAKFNKILVRNGLVKFRAVYLTISLVITGPTQLFQWPNICFWLILVDWHPFPLEHGNMVLSIFLKLLTNNDKKSAIWNNFTNVFILLLFCRSSNIGILSCSLFFFDWSHNLLRTTRLRPVGWVKYAVRAISIR